MDGYFKPKHKDQIHELRILELDEIEHVDDDDEIESSFKDPIKKCYQKSEIFHRCPRCKTLSKMQANDPYCPECNWDSLIDHNLEVEKCVA